MKKRINEYKNFTTHAGLAIYDRLWDKYGLSEAFDFVVQKHSGKPFSAIMRNLLFRNLIDANSMNALADLDKQEYLLQKNASLDRTTYGRNLKRLNKKDIEKILAEFNSKVISQKETDEDTIMIYDTTAIKAEGKSYEDTKWVYDSCSEKMIRGYALNKLLLKTKKKLVVEDFDLNIVKKELLLGKFKRVRENLGVNKIVFDAGPENKGMPFYEELTEEGFLFYTKATSSWKFNYGKDYTVSKLKELLRDRLEKEKIISLEVFKGDIPLRLIFVFNDPRVYLTNDLEISAEKVLAYYEWRWDIEISFREEKQHLGLNKLPCWNKQGIRTHFLLVLLAFVLSRLIILKVDIVKGIKLIKRKLINVFAYIKGQVLYFTENFRFSKYFTLFL